MNKKFWMVLIVLFIGLSFSAQIFAAKKGNGRKGKYLFRKNCRTCHIENGAATALSPISKTQADWSIVFKKDAFSKLTCSAEWEKRKEKDLLDIYTYMYDHAFDSPSPLKCK
jgi:hypothetical protein